MLTPRLIAWLLIILSGVNSCVASLLMKQSQIRRGHDDLRSIFFSPWIWLSLVFWAINVLLFAKSLREIPVAIAYPAMASMGFVLLTIASKLVYKEPVGVHQYLGIAIVIGGLFLLSKP